MCLYIILYIILHTILYYVNKMIDFFIIVPCFNFKEPIGDSAVPLPAGKR
jgi:hypothetical protein